MLNLKEHYTRVFFFVLVIYFKILDYNLYIQFRVIFSHLRTFFHAYIISFDMI